MISKNLTRLARLLFNLITAHSVLATNVSGTINGTWTTNNSPYQVEGNIQVAVLTIDPGVTVTFAGNYNFQVAGVLKAHGTPAAPITFMGTNGGWQGIYFNNSSPGSLLAYCTVSNSINSGIRITNSSVAICNCLIAGNTTPGNGGGILVSDAANSLSLENCTIINNTSGLSGGGICAFLGTNTLSISGCIISNNIANPSWNLGTTGGGGVYVSGTSVLEDCIVSGNTCQAEAAAWTDTYALGGGLYSDTGTATIKRSIFAANTVNCQVGETHGSWGGWGGGVYTDGRSLAMTNSIFSGNGTVSWNSVGHGGGLYVDSSVESCSVINCTFAYNTTEGIYSTPAVPLVMNSILFFNNTNGTQISGPTNVTYCDVQNGLTGTGNMNLNPIFLDTTHLIIVSGSPCINKGSPNAIYNNVYFPPSLGTHHNDMGAHGGHGAGAIMTLQAWPQFEIRCFGGVPGYNYEIDATTNLVDWQAVQQYQIANLGDGMDYLETNSMPFRFYKLNVTQ